MQAWAARHLDLESCLSVSRNLPVPPGRVPRLAPWAGSLSSSLLLVPFTVELAATSSAPNPLQCPAHTPVRASACCLFF